MKGSPGGILLIAAGILFLNLGWTGRWAAVWDALRGSSSGSGSGTDGGSGGPVPPGNLQPPATPGTPEEAAAMGCILKPATRSCSSHDYAKHEVSIGGTPYCCPPQQQQTPSAPAPPAANKCAGPRPESATGTGVRVGNPHDCCTGETILTVSSNGVSLYTCASGNAITTARNNGYQSWFGAGEAFGPRRNYSIVELPTGFFGSRYQPNG